ncbi:calcium-binding and coiled-coil domain-containing protein 1-like [Galleria mellonella]|uniref:Calcium-binding and coiled-coil domain-containing protein 1-like n=1 Tax=Galleria mellonella TaxID=7137 RepID=A0A6J1WEC6_GALME|nr:calcium-binding and coiled-coil domain-containing protein 1-like [Galleria mellonella]
MGIENMRRWPMYIVFALCILLLLSLFNSWSMEAELRVRIAEISTQLQECSKQQTSCMEESLTLMEQRDGYVSKVNDLDKQKVKLSDDVAEYKSKIAKSETKVNRTRVDLEFCKTELQSLQNLQVSKSATLETLRLEKDTLTAQLTDRKQKIEDLEKEIERLKSALTTKSAPAVPSKVTPAAQPPKLSPALNVHNPLNEPVIEDNAAKEDLEDTNAVNEAPDFDQQF